MTKALGSPAAHLRLLGPLARGDFERELGRLPVTDPSSFDAFPAPVWEGEVVLCGALCAVDDLDGAVASLRGAERVVFLEHVGRHGLAGRAQAAAGAVLSRLPGGCRTDHDVPAALRRGGFVVTDLERLTMPTPFLAYRPWVRGVATPRRSAA